MAEERKLTDYYRFLPNLCQTSQERREKYWLIRSLGFNSYQAYRYRDCRLSTIERFFSIELGLTKGPGSAQKNRDRLHTITSAAAGPSC